MSDIKVGDLVVVVRACCGASFGEIGGWIFKVKKVAPYTRSGIWYCDKCHSSGTDLAAYSDNIGPHQSSGGPIPWLRRIPPLSELESTETKEETPA